MSAPTVEYWTDRNTIVLKNSLIARQFSLLTGSWTKLRVGMLFGLTTGSQADIAGTPRFAIGISSGSNNVFGDAACGHFLGYRSNTLTWVYGSSSLQTNEQYRHADGQFIRRGSGSVGDLVTGDPITSNWYLICPVVSASYWKGRNVTYLDFVKLFPVNAYSCSIWYSNASTNPTYGMETISTFLAAMQAATPTADGLLVASSVLSLPVDETLSGSFDSVNIMWNRESPVSEMLIYAVAVSVLE